MNVLVAASSALSERRCWLGPRPGAGLVRGGSYQFPAKKSDSWALASAGTRWWNQPSFNLFRGIAPFSTFTSFSPKKTPLLGRFTLFPRFLPYATGWYEPFNSCFSRQGQRTSRRHIILTDSSIGNLAHSAEGGGYPITSGPCRASWPFQGGSPPILICS